jgi:hypothetical protein
VVPEGKLLQRQGRQPEAFIVVRQGVVRVQDQTTTAPGEKLRSSCTPRASCSARAPLLREAGDC